MGCPASDELSSKTCVGLGVIIPFSSDSTTSLVERGYAMGHDQLSVFGVTKGDDISRMQRRRPDWPDRNSITRKQHRPHAIGLNGINPATPHVPNPDRRRDNCQTGGGQYGDVVH